MKDAPGKIEINIIVNKLIGLFDYFNNYGQIHEQALKDLLSLLNQSLILSEIHVIDCIGKNKLPNTTFIAGELGMTKGAISKITSKLLEKGFIKANYLEDNKKEIYYSMTAKGKEVSELHDKIHDLENQKIMNILSQYNKKELQIISNFLDALLNTAEKNNPNS